MIAVQVGRFLGCAKPRPVAVGKSAGEKILGESEIVVHGRGDVGRTLSTTCALSDAGCQLPHLFEGGLLLAHGLTHLVGRVKDG